MHCAARPRPKLSTSLRWPRLARKELINHSSIWSSAQPRSGPIGKAQVEPTGQGHYRNASSSRGEMFVGDTKANLGGL